MNFKTFLFLSIFIFLNLSCFRQAKIDSPPYPEDLYNKGMEYFQAKKYYKAISVFQELRDSFPLDPFGILAELRLGDSYYRLKTYSEALTYYEDFKKLHPTNPELPYAAYQIGMVYFQQILPPQRDQGNTLKALAQFQELITSFPQSPYQQKAERRIKSLNERLAAHELSVAEYYYHEKKYDVSIDRLKKIMEKYPSISISDKILFYMGKIYLAKQEKNAARDLFSRIIKEYPKSSYKKEVKGILTQLDKPSTK